MCVACFHQLSSLFRKFEAQLRQPPDGVDQLDVYYRYAKWYEQHTTGANTKQLRKLIQNALSQFNDALHYRNDHRWLYLWLKFVSANCVTQFSISVPRQH
jgi:hypothetical protein